MILPRVGVVELLRSTWSSACADRAVVKQTISTRPIDMAVLVRSRIIVTLSDLANDWGFILKRLMTRVSLEASDDGAGSRACCGHSRRPASPTFWSGPLFSRPFEARVLNRANIDDGAASSSRSP